MRFLKSIQSVIFFVDDIHAASRWYADLFGLTVNDVQYENPNYAFIQAPGVLVGFHPADAKNSSGAGGGGGTTSYWSVDDLDVVMAQMIARGAHLYRGPMATDLGARVCMLIDPFGNTIGLNQTKC